MCAIWFFIQFIQQNRLCVFSLLTIIIISFVCCIYSIHHYTLHSTPQLHTVAARIHHSFFFFVGYYFYFYEYDYYGWIFHRNNCHCFRIFRIMQTKNAIACNYMGATTRYKWIMNKKKRPQTREFVCFTVCHLQLLSRCFRRFSTVFFRLTCLCAWMSAKTKTEKAARKEIA